MECLDREKVFAFAHRMLAPGEEAEVNRHLETCAPCREAAAEYARLDAVLDEWKPAEPTPAFDARVRSALATDGERPHGMYGLGWLPVLAPALMILALFVSVLVIRERRRHIGITTAPAVATPGPQPVPPARVETPDEQAQSELTMYQNLAVLEDYDMLRDFDVLSEMPRGGKKVEN